MGWSAIDILVSLLINEKVRTFPDNPESRVVRRGGD